MKKRGGRRRKVKKRKKTIITEDLKKTMPREITKHTKKCMMDGGGNENRCEKKTS